MPDSSPFPVRRTLGPGTVWRISAGPGQVPIAMIFAEGAGPEAADRHFAAADAGFALNVAEVALAYALRLDPRLVDRVAPARKLQILRLLMAEGREATEKGLLDGQPADR